MLKRMLILALGLLAGCANASQRVVVYCAHDREFAENILRDFEMQSGLKVVVRWDTEANKAVGLYEDLLREKERPRCDVHWNNEILATIRLQQQGVLDPYDSPAAAPFPDRFKAKDHAWTAFAARARIILVNTKLVPDPQDHPKSLADLTEPRWKGQVAMARPFFGTTASHAACLFESLGPDAAQAFFQKLKDNGIQLVSGNKQVAVGVGQGRYAVGLTDTDDAMAEIDAGNPVTMIFPNARGLGTLFIPNTVAVIKGCPNPAGARKLVDYLLSPGVEAKLAQSKSRQIPLNPHVEAELPKAMKTPRTTKAMAVDFTGAAQRWEKTRQEMEGIFSR